MSRRHGLSARAEMGSFLQISKLTCSTGMFYLDMPFAAISPAFFSPLVEEVYRVEMPIPRSYQCRVCHKATAKGLGGY